MIVPLWISSRRRDGGPWSPWMYWPQANNLPTRPLPLMMSVSTPQIVTVHAAITGG